jgi:site-specific recombinase XerD
LRSASRRRVLPGRSLKPTTLADYKSILHGHLTPFFDQQKPASIEAEHVDGYIAAETAEGLSPKSISNQLGLLRLMFKTAKRWRLVPHNPVDDVDSPRGDSTE